MSDNAPLRGISYADVAIALLGLLFVIGQTRGHAVTGLAAWAPAIAMAVWLAVRSRSTAGATWPFPLAGAGMMAGLVVLFWRLGVPVFMAAIVIASFLIVLGLALRAKRVSDRWSYGDLFQVLAGIVSVTLTFVLAEMALRLAPGLVGQEARQAMQADIANYGVAHPYIGHLHRPNLTFEIAGRDFRTMNHVDGRGFRNTEPVPARADIVAVGDSVTFGYGVSDERAWPAIVAKSLAPARLVNLGLIGAGPEQYGRVYETFGVALHPKLLLVGLFGQNDFWDAGMFDEWLRVGAEPNFMIWRDFGRPAQAVFSLRSPLAAPVNLVRAAGYRLLRHSYLFKLLRALRGTGTSGPARPFTFADGSRLDLFEDDYASKRRLAQPDRSEFAHVTSALQRMHARASREGTHVLVVLQPGKEEVYLPLLGDTTPDSTSALRIALDTLGIEYLDLGPAFRERAAAGERLFFQVDGHPNAEGYALTARTVQAFIAQHAVRLGLARRD